MKNNILVPIIATAAAAGILTYLFATEDGAEARKKMSALIEEHFPEASERLQVLQDKIKDQLFQLLNKQDSQSDKA